MGLRYCGDCKCSCVIFCHSISGKKKMRSIKKKTTLPGTPNNGTSIANVPVSDPGNLNNETSIANMPVSDPGTSNSETSIAYLLVSDPGTSNSEISISNVPVSDSRNQNSDRPSHIEEHEHYQDCKIDGPEKICNTYCSIT